MDITKIHELQRLNLFYDKDILIYKEEEDKIICCDINGCFNETIDFIKKLKGKFNYEKKNKYILSQCLLCENKNDYHSNIQECYNSVFRISTELKKKSNGKINIFKTGDFRSTILKLLLDNKMLDYDINEPETIKNYREYQWLNEASKGALIYAKDDYKGNIIQYDKNSYYPSILKSDKLMIPIKEGEFRKIDKLPKNFRKTGIYKCKVIGNISPFLFRYNSHHFYTNTDLKRAKQLNYELELINDGEDNFLYYSEDKILSSDKIFKQYITYLYDLKIYYKEQNDKEILIYIKKLLSAVWGVLTQVRKFDYIIHDFDCDNFENKKDGDEIIQRRKFNDEYDKITVINIYNPCETRYARLKPFMLAMGRYIIGKDIEEDVLNDKIVKIHTDGFCVIEGGKEYKISDELGGLKIEKQGLYHIKNVNKMIELEK